MVRKSEAEAAIRHLVGKWMKETGVAKGQAEMPNFGDFKRWVRMQGFGHYLDFRSVAGADYDAESWQSRDPWLPGAAWRKTVHGGMSGIDQCRRSQAAA